MKLIGVLIIHINIKAATNAFDKTNGDFGTWLLGTINRFITIHTNSPYTIAVTHLFFDKMESLG